MPQTPSTSFSMYDIFAESLYLAITLPIVLERSKHNKDHKFSPNLRLVYYEYNISENYSKNNPKAHSEKEILNVSQFAFMQVLTQQSMYQAAFNFNNNLSMAVVIFDTGKACCMHGTTDCSVTYKI